MRVVVAKVSSVTFNRDLILIQMAGEAQNASPALSVTEAFLTRVKNLPPPAPDGQNVQVRPTLPMPETFLEADGLMGVTA